MSAQEIQKKVKYINDSNGKHTDVIIPYSMFEELFELKMSIEIFTQNDVQKSIKRARKEITEGKTETFQHADEAVRWLRK